MAVSGLCLVQRAAASRGAAGVQVRQVPGTRSNPREGKILLSPERPGLKKKRVGTLNRWSGPAEGRDKLPR